MNRFILCQTQKQKLAVLALATVPLLSTGANAQTANSTSAMYHFDKTLWLLLVVVLIASALSTHSSAQESAETPTPQIESVDDWGAIYAQSREEKPPRPAKSDTQLHSQHDATADIQTETQAGLSSSSWSNSKTSKSQLNEDHELSVEPGTSPLLPSDAPAWVGSLPDLSGDVHRLFVGGNIAESAGEAAEGLDFLLVATVSEYIDTHLLKRDGAARALTGKITADYVWKNLVDEQAGYIARLNTPGQAMFQKWVTLSITPEQRAVILHWDREALQRERLAPVGLGLVSLLGGVGLLHLLLRRGNR